MTHDTARTIRAALLTLLAFHATPCRAASYSFGAGFTIGEGKMDNQDLFGAGGKSEDFTRKGFELGVTARFGSPGRVFNDWLSLGFCLGNNSGSGREYDGFGTETDYRIDESFSGVVLANTFAFKFGTAARLGPALVLQYAGDDLNAGIGLMLAVSKHANSGGLELGVRRLENLDLFGDNRYYTEFVVRFLGGASAD